MENLNKIKSKRINFIVNEIQHEKIADIGTDHAYIPILACLLKKSTRAIASDIRKLPLEFAKKNIEYYNLVDKISIRLGSGLSKLNENEVDTIILAGIGANTIINILEDGKNILENTRQLIISPQSGLIKIRKYIHKIGFKIKNEIIAYENGLYYHIINLIKGTEEYTKKEYILGKILIEKNEEVFKNYLKEQIKDKKWLLEKPINDEKRREIKEFIEICESVL
ncbi:MAG: class I SAM-dependent methyltransferase [Defluviitaleaceae bacterium]|nr:class I SAM-dependent methyltransferase [Defluviitaleaceae bacterium]